MSQNDPYYYYPRDPLMEQPFNVFIERKYKPLDAIFIKKTVAQLGLPAPGKNEYMDSDEGAIIFLNDYGIVIRISAQALFDNIQKSHILPKPIGSIGNGRVRVALYPGLYLPNNDTAEWRESAILSRMLAWSGIYFWDSGTTNMGFFPYNTLLFSRGLPTTFDNGSVYDPKNSLFKNRFKPGTQIASHKQVGGLDKTLIEAMYKRAQKELYGHLQRSFRLAWPDERRPPDPSKMARFWRVCHRHAQHIIHENNPDLRPLKIDWCVTKNRSASDNRFLGQVRYYASAYQRRMRNHPMHRHLRTPRQRIEPFSRLRYGHF